MATDLKLPLLGDTMTEGTLARWLLPDGAEVTAGQPLYELETDKVSFTVEAPESGRLSRLVAEGDVVAVGTVVGRLLEAAEPAGKGEVLATPAARQLARQLGVDLSALGPGRIREADVRAASADTLPHPGVPAKPASWGGGVGEAPGEAGGRGTQEADEPGVPYSGRRRAIGERMVHSLRTAAQLTHVTEARVDAALEMIDGLNQEWRDDGVVVTLTRLVVRACAVALGAHPQLNARLEGDEIIPSEAVHIGLAVDQASGLIVPVLRDVHLRSLKDVSQALRDLTQRAASGGLTQSEVEAGTFTVTSLAGSVVDAFTPILNAPQVAILGLGRVREVAGFEADRVVRHRVTTLSLTFDHRALDGAPAARFLGRLTELLARPYLLMDRLA
jgi:pyruvate dehydrogenase E2 component (dihydrolipoamide acetyltransferase)